MDNNISPILIKNALIRTTNNINILPLTEPPLNSSQSLPKIQHKLIPTQPQNPHNPPARPFLTNPSIPFNNVMPYILTDVILYKMYI